MKTLNSMVQTKLKDPQCKLPETKIRSNLDKEMNGILDKICARMNVNFLRGMAYFFNKIWRQMYDQIIVNRNIIE